METRAKAERLTFDPVTHLYRLDGDVIPSVTQILKGVGLSDYSHIPADTLQRAAERGTVVHQIIEFYEKGVLDESSIDPALRGYFESYLRAKDAGLLFDDNRPEEIEKQVFSEKYKYAGTLDQSYCDWINDIKTGQPQPEHGLQLTAYWMCEHDITAKPWLLTCTYLHDDGSTADVVKYDYEPLAWLSMASCYRWREKHGKLK